MTDDRHGCAIGRQIEWQPDREASSRRADYTGSPVGVYPCKKKVRIDLQDGTSMMRACRKCQHCQTNIVNWHVGRFLAEAMSCYDIWFFTGTYADRPYEPDPEKVENACRLRRSPCGEKTPCVCKRLYIENGKAEDLAREAKAGIEGPVAEHFAKMVRAIRDDGNKQLRKAGRSERVDLSTFATWEAGSEKGRGHIHALLFFRAPDVPGEILEAASVSDAMRQAKPPAWMPATETSVTTNREEYLRRVHDPQVADLTVPEDESQYWKYWPYGRVQVQSVRLGVRHKVKLPNRTVVEWKKPSVFSRLRYVGKYVAKSNLWPRDGAGKADIPMYDGNVLSSELDPKPHFQNSPALGKDFFLARAAQHARAGIPIREWSYSFSDQRKAPSRKEQWKTRQAIEEGRTPRAHWERGDKRVFPLTGTMRHYMYAEWVRVFEERHPDKEMPKEAFDQAHEAVDWVAQRHLEKLVRTATRLFGKGASLEPPDLSEYGNWYLGLSEIEKQLLAAGAPELPAKERRMRAMLRKGFTHAQAAQWIRTNGLDVPMPNAEIWRAEREKARHNAGQIEKPVIHRSELTGPKRVR